MTRVWVALTIVFTLIIVGAGLASDWPPGLVLASATALSAGTWLFVSAIRGARDPGVPPEERSARSRDQ